MARQPFWMAGTPLARKGAALVAVIALIILGLAMKNPIKIALRGGDTITAEFSENYNLAPGLSKVKVAGLQVGLVTGIEHTDRGTAVVEMKVDDDARERLGSTPTARIVPLTLLGGQYSVELHRGGNGEYDGSRIPMARTSLPVELDRVLEALPARTRAATQRLLGSTDKTLRRGGTANLRKLADKAPAVLPPAGTFLEALQGERPGRDLPTIVTDLQDMAAVLDARDAAVVSILDDLDAVTATLASRRGKLAAVVGELPETLTAADRGLEQLDGTLDKLETATTRLRPSIRRLEPLLDELGPTLREARPVLAKLPPLTRDARAVLHTLVPAIPVATGIVDDVRGPVIERVEGPILDKLDRTWQGTGPYKSSGRGVQAGNKFYEEIAYMIANLDRSSMTQDAQGSLLNFQAGAGTGTVVPLGLDQQLAALLPQLKGGRY